VHRLSVKAALLCRRVPGLHNNFISKLNSSAGHSIANCSSDCSLLANNPDNHRSPNEHLLDY